MFNMILMLLFSVYLMAYGFIALFKKDWIWKIRAMSARIEGKGDLKRDDTLAQRTNARANIVATLSLVLGATGLIVTISMFYISATATA